MMWLVSAEIRKVQICFFTTIIIIFGIKCHMESAWKIIYRKHFLGQYVRLRSKFHDVFIIKFLHFCKWSAAKLHCKWSAAKLPCKWSAAKLQVWIPKLDLAKHEKNPANSFCNTKYAYKFSHFWEPHNLWKVPNRHTSWPQLPMLPSCGGYKLWRCNRIQHKCCAKYGASSGLPYILAADTIA